VASSLLAILFSQFTGELLARVVRPVLKDVDFSGQCHQIGRIFDIRAIFFIIEQLFF
jgi:hypothetical protein